MRTLHAAASLAGTSVNEFVLNIALSDARRLVDLMRGLSPDAERLEELAAPLDRKRRSAKAKGSG